MNADQASKLEWCQVIDGVVHAAIWRPATKGDPANGYLTTYTTVSTRKGEEVARCMGQSWCDLDKLVPYDDRAAHAKKVKAKVCKVCEEE